MLEFVLVAEGKNDEQVIPCLVNRVLCEKGEDWVKDNFDDDPERLWKWAAIEQDSLFRFTSWAHIDKLGNSYKKKLRIFHRPGEGYRTAETRKAIALYFLLRKENPADALILSRDLDKHPEIHRKSMEVAREETHNKISQTFPILLATPKSVLEVWMLHGFEPENEHEQNQLKALRQEFGFDPCEHGHHFNSEQAKAVVIKLISDTDGNKNMVRRERCWATTDLKILGTRGENSHLADFFNEIENHLIPLLTGKPPASS